MSNETPEPIKEVPVLTNETWELLEFRMWTKFRTKLWSYVGAFLTLSTLAGVFGVSGYIDRRVDQKVEAERKNLERARLEFIEESQDIVRKIKLTHYITAEYSSDLTVFDRALRASKDCVNLYSGDGCLSNKDSKRLLEILSSLEGFEYAYFDYYLAVREAGRVLNDIGYAKEELDTGKLEYSDWELLNDGLNKYEIPGLIVAIQMYPHLFSLLDVQRKIVSNNLKVDLNSPVTRASLYQFYENIVSKEYLARMERYSLPFKIHISGGRFGWATLSPSAKEAFILFETEVKDNAN